MSSSARPRVLVVDDSAIVRQTLLQLLEGDELAVTTAADPLIAAEKMNQAPPDVILLDLEMPRMDGLTFLRRVMATSAVPVIVCSAAAGPGTIAALRALELGAVDVVEKPRLAVREFLLESKIRLTDAIRAALLARRRPSRAEPTEAALPPRAKTTQVGPFSQRVVAIGASTGGPEALRRVLVPLASDTSAIVVVQHMPSQFTRELARALDRDCSLHVSEARTGDRLERGRVLIAPGDFHLSIERTIDGAGFVACVGSGPLVSRHRPSVDVLFRSVAEAAGPRALGILLTGMGDDGAEGLGAMRAAGAETIAQDEDSSVVFGMPKEAIRRGFASSVLPLDRIGGAIETAELLAGR